MSSSRFDQLIRLGPQPMRGWRLTTLDLQRSASITFDDVEWRVGVTLQAGAGTANWWLTVAPKGELDLGAEQRLRAKDTFQRLSLALYESRPLVGGWMPTANGITGRWSEYNLEMEDAWREFNRPIRVVDPERIFSRGSSTRTRLARPRSQAEMTRRMWRLVELVRDSRSSVRLVRSVSWQRRNRVTSASRGWSIIHAVFLQERAASASVNLSRSGSVSSAERAAISRGFSSFGLAGGGNWHRSSDGSWDVAFDLPNAQTGRAREQMERLEALPIGELLRG